MFRTIVFDQDDNRQPERRGGRDPFCQFAVSAASDPDECSKLSMPVDSSDDNGGASQM